MTKLYVNVRKVRNKIEKCLRDEILGLASLLLIFSPFVADCYVRKNCMDEYQVVRLVESYFSFLFVTSYTLYINCFCQWVTRQPWPAQQQRK